MVTTPPGFSIDTTEVTRGQYDAWLAKGPSTSGQTAECSWNTTFARDTTSFYCTSSTLTEQYPVACIDWCDAYGYCRGVGKRLCGQIGGGHSDYYSWTDVASEWYNACSSGGLHPYPYGDQAGGNICRDASLSPAPVASKAGCVSSEPGYEDVFDLCGNVWEWTDACDAYLGATDNCQRRGGTYESNVTSCELHIIAPALTARNATSYTTGFRCCSDP